MWVTFAAMLNAGVLGYVLSRSGDTELLLAIRSACRGRRYCDPLLGSALADVLLGQCRSKALAKDAVLAAGNCRSCAIARGFTGPEIARQLGLKIKSL